MVIGIMKLERALSKSVGHQLCNGDKFGVTYYERAERHSPFCSSV